MAATIEDASSTSESILSSNMMCSSDNPSSEFFSKPSLSYIALIAKVILFAPSQKLNLASIYRAMEEQFPYLRSRGPGWRNSVRHNLSVNECFVKVSCCEDGRGHYWGVHQANLRDFQQGNFSQCRRARGRRERSNKAAGCLTWMDTNCLLCRFYESRSLACVAPQCPLQEPRRYQLSSLDWPKQLYQPWRVNVASVQSPSWMRNYYSLERLPDSCGRATAERGHGGNPMNSRLHCWETADPELTGMRESYDSRFMMPPVEACMFPGCWCMSPVNKELKQNLYYL